MILKNNSIFLEMGSHQDYTKNYILNHASSDIKFFEDFVNINKKYSNLKMDSFLIPFNLNIVINNSLFGFIYSVINENVDPIIKEFIIEKELIRYDEAFFSEKMFNNTLPNTDIIINLIHDFYPKVKRSIINRLSPFIINRYENLIKLKNSNSNTNLTNFKILLIFIVLGVDVVLNVSFIQATRIVVNSMKKEGVEVIDLINELSHILYNKALFVKGRLKSSEFKDIQKIISLDEIYDIIKSIENDSAVLVSIGNELVEMLIISNLFESVNYNKGGKNVVQYIFKSIL
jgi:hypothetical protein